MISNIPKNAWLLTAASGFVLSTGVSVATIRSANLSVEVADFRLDSTARLNKGLDLTRQLEEQAEQLKASKQAYSELKSELNKLKKSTPQLKKLEPKIEKLDRINNQTNLDLLKEELEETSQKLENELEQLADPEPER